MNNFNVRKYGDNHTVSIETDGVYSLWDEVDWIKNEETIKGVEELMEKVYQAGIKDAATLIKKSFEGYDVF